MVLPPREHHYQRFALDDLEISGVFVVAVRGGLDIATAPQFGRTLDAATGRDVLVDLSDCSFLDSTSLRHILRADGESHRLAVACRPGGSPARVIHLIVKDHLPVFDDREAALRWLSPR